MEKEIIISIQGEKAEGCISINLDNYNEKLIDMLYMKSIKEMLIKVIEEELKGEDNNAI